MSDRPMRAVPNADFCLANARPLPGHDLGLGLAGEAAAMLRESILSGELVAGQRLFAQSVGNRLGMSRTPVREAFRTLIAEGLLKVGEKNRLMVAPVSPVKAADGSASDLRLVIAELEAMAARFASQRMTWERIRSLELQIDSLLVRAKARDWKACADIEKALHRFVVQHAHNPSLFEAWQTLSPGLQTAAMAIPSIDPRHWTAVAAGLREIADAISQRQADRAEELMRDHWGATAPTEEAPAPKSGRRAVAARRGRAGWTKPASQWSRRNRRSV